MKVHQIRIPFNVTEHIRRFVHVYLLEADLLYLIDSGVAGSERQIMENIAGIGRDVSEIRGIFLTHAHPDHIGSARWFQERTGCLIYASAGEKGWIEDVDLQFRERPIPNFYQLAGKSSRVDVTVKDGDRLMPEPGLAIRVIRTAGHSADAVSYLADRHLFTGDAVPVPGDVPILIDERETRKTLALLKKLEGVDVYCPAWDRICSRTEMMKKLDEAAGLIDCLKSAVLALDDETDPEGLADRVCFQHRHADAESKPPLRQNCRLPAGACEKMSCYFLVDVYIDDGRSRGAYDHCIETGIEF